MERQLFFPEMPQPQDWGEKKNVPLNINAENSTDENGQPKTGYRADVVPKVEQPLTVDNIVDAAIASEYSEEAQKRIMRNMARENDPEVEAYKNFTNEIRTAAIAAGYE